MADIILNMQHIGYLLFNISGQTRQIEYLIYM